MRPALHALAALAALLPLPYRLTAADPAPLKPLNLPVNTAADEDEPHVAADMLTLFYTSNVNKGKEDILVARRRAASSAWPAKGAVLGPYVSTAADDRSVFVTAGAYPRFLFFATKKDKETKNYDLYAAVKNSATAETWSAPTPVQAVATAADELHPWVTADGKALYFSRKKGEGWRVFVASRARATGPGGWDEPKPAEGIPADFHHATLTPDGRTMYLQGPLDKGRWGLFVSASDAKGEWAAPVELDELNAADGKTGDRSPNLSRDGKFLYFSSDRPGGKGGLDLWAVAVASLKKR